MLEKWAGTNQGVYSSGRYLLINEHYLIMEGLEKDRNTNDKLH